MGGRVVPKSHRRRLAGLLVLLLASGFLVRTSFAQDQALSPLIENTGEATVRVAPNYVDFWLHGDNVGETILEAMAASLRREAELSEALREEKLRPQRVEFSGPAVTDLTALRVRISARVRFNLRSFQSSDTIALEFARLCDSIVTIATALDFEIVGPLLGANDENALIQSAVRQATGNAYSAASAVAASLSGKPVSVDTARVISVSLGQAPDTLSEEPNLGSIPCTARVSVRYSVSEEE